MGQEFWARWAGLFQHGQWKAVSGGPVSEQGGVVSCLLCVSTETHSFSRFLIVFAFWSFAIHISGIKLVTTSQGFAHWIPVLTWAEPLPSPGMRFSVLRPSTDWGSQCGVGRVGSDSVATCRIPSTHLLETRGSLPV